MTLKELNDWCEQQGIEDDAELVSLGDRKVLVAAGGGGMTIELGPVDQVDAMLDTIHDLGG